MKSVFMSILEKIGELFDILRIDDSVVFLVLFIMIVVIIDGMVEFQFLDKLYWVSSCEKLVKYFNDCFFYKYCESEEV